MEAERSRGHSLFLAGPHPIPHSASPPKRHVMGARVNPEPHERSHPALGADFTLRDAFPQKCVKKSV